MAYYEENHPMRLQWREYSRQRGYYETCQPIITPGHLDGIFAFWDREIHTGSIGTEPGTEFTPLASTMIRALTVEPMFQYLAAYEECVRSGRIEGMMAQTGEYYGNHMPNSPVLNFFDFLAVHERGATEMAHYVIRAQSFMRFVVEQHLAGNYPTSQSVDLSSILGWNYFQGYGSVNW